MLGRTDSRLRMLAILLVFVVFGSAAGLRLGYWQVVAADELTERYEAQTAWAPPPRAVRGDILDRDGELLARLVSYDSLDAHPDIIDPANHVGIVDTLEVILDLDAAERERYLAALADVEDQHEVLRPRLTFEESEALASAIDAGLLKGIALQPHEFRRYPVKGGQQHTSLAATVLGFVRADNRGGDGVESYYDDRLTTVDPETIDLASIEGLPEDLSGVEPAALALTLDAGLQKQVEKDLTSVWAANAAKSVSAIVMDPQTGAILAAASVPSYDANEFATAWDRDSSSLRNRVFSDQYEPGSVMKIFTAAAALDAGKVTPTTKIRDQVQLRFWDDIVQNADHQSEGLLAVKDGIALSRNVVAAKLARMLAPNDTQKASHRLYDFWQKVGMTRPTGVDIAAEASGSWADPNLKPWAALDLANRSFGQGVAVTLPQLARGVSTFVNGGYLVQPHLVADGAAGSVEPVKVLEPKTARQAKDILTHVTGSVPWYAQGSLIRGYHIGGKTGTAQIWDVEKGTWKQRRFNHSFVGFVGGRKQEYVIAVRIEEPRPLWIKQGQIPLNIESYEAFQMVARATIEQLDMKKSRDKAAGRPIIGTAAAAMLDPVRDREAQRQSRQDARRQERKETEAAVPRRAKGDDIKVASEAAASRGDPT